MQQVSPNRGSGWLLLGAMLSLLAALLHIGVIIGGPDWYRFFGAPESYAVAAQSGSVFPALITTGIAAVLTLWAGFALSGAGLTIRLPLLRTGLVAITAIYLLRGALVVPAFLYVPYPEGAFDYWSSAIVLIYGLVYARGTWLAWSAMELRTKDTA